MYIPTTIKRMPEPAIKWAPRSVFLRTPGFCKLPEFTKTEYIVNGKGILGL